MLSLSAALFPLLLVLLLLASPVRSQNCTGATIINGPTAEVFSGYFGSSDQLLGSARVLTVTQQIRQLSMSFIWDVQTASNTAPVHVSLALYGPATCGPQGDSLLLGVTTVRTFAANSLSFTPILVTLPLVTPVIVAPGTYYILAETDSPKLVLVTGSTASNLLSIVADSYSRNSYNYSAANFPPVTLLLTYYPGQDAEGQIISSVCNNSEAVTPPPTCTPTPFLSYPPNTAAVAPCSGSTLLTTPYFNNNSAANFEGQVPPGYVLLTPTTVAAAQTIYAVSYLIHPETAASVVFTMRAAVYLQSATSTSFILAAQSNQTTVSGSVLSGQFTYLYFPIYPPLVVAAGTVIYMDLIVDQAGLFTVYSTAGFVYEGLSLVSSNTSAPSALLTVAIGGDVAARGLLGCAGSGVAPPAGPCSGAVIINGPLTENFAFFYPSDQLLGSTRVLSVTQQVSSVSMSLYWFSPYPNSSPVSISMALYGPPNCGPQGESQLLAVTSVFTFAPGALSPYEILAPSLPLTSPIIVAPGAYTVFAESSNPLLNIVGGSVQPGYHALVADSFTKNNYNFQSANYPNVTYIVTALPDQDTLAEIVGTTCTSNATLTPLPICVPTPFFTLPLNPAAALPCTGANVISSTPFNLSYYNFENDVLAGTVLLTPLTVSVAQTLYSVSFLVHPETTANVTYTMRAAVYTLSSTPNTFTFAAQSNQTTMSGFTLAGQFTYLYFPISPPVYVPAGGTVYINWLVDQAGLVTVYDLQGQSYNSSAVLSTSASAPTTIVSAGHSSLDSYHGALACATATPPGGACYGGSPIVTGPVGVVYTGYYTSDQLLGSTRVLTVTQQVNALSMSFYWSAFTGNTVPVRFSLALYGPPNCGPQGESQLLAVTGVYTFAIGELVPYETTLQALALTSFIIVAPGSYTIFAETDNAALNIATGSSVAGSGNLVADAYTRNFYNFSSARFPAVTFVSTYSVGLDSAAQIIGQGCTGSGTTTLTPLPTCTPTPFLTSPSNPAAALPCTAATAVTTSTYSNTAYKIQSAVSPDTVSLTPLTVTTGQMVYSLSFLVHPETSATTTFTLRPALYTLSSSNTFTLLAQASQTTVQGSTLAGQFTYLYFPLAQPVYVAAGTTVYLNPLVDQSGLVLVYAQPGSSYTSPLTPTTAQSAPTSITSTAGGAQDASIGLLGCPGSAPAGPGATPSGSSSSNNNGAIIGGVLGGVGGALLCCLMLMGCLVVWRRGKKNVDEEEESTRSRDDPYQSTGPSEAEMSTLEASQVEGRQVEGQMHDEDV